MSLKTVAKSSTQSFHNGFITQKKKSHYYLFKHFDMNFYIRLNWYQIIIS